LTLPRVTLVIIVVAACTNLSSLPAAASIPVNPAILVLAVSVVVLEVLRGRLTLRWPLVLTLAFGAIILMVPSMLAGLDQLASWLVVKGLLKDLLFLVVVYFLASAAGAARLLACTLTLVMAGLGGLAVVNQFLLGNASTFGGLAVVSSSGGVGVSTLRNQGPFDDPNFFGRLLVLAVPLALALAVQAWNRRLKLQCALWCAAELSILGGIYMTGSRGAMLATGAAVVVWMVLAGPQFRRRLIFLPVLLIPVLLIPGIGSRLLTLDNLAPSSSFAEEDGSVLERAAAARVTFAIFKANPVLGVGPGNANTLSEPYAAAGDGLVHREVAAHNTYLQLAAEDGLIGLLGWLTFLVGVLVVAVKTVRAYPVLPNAPPVDARLLAAAGAASMAAWMSASVFLHFAFLRPLFVVVAMVGVLASEAPQRVVQPRSEGPERRVPWRRAVVLSVVAVLVVGIGAAALPFVRPKAWMAEVQVSLQPGAEKGDAYRISLLNRRAVVATYAEVVRQAGARYVGDRGTLTVEASGQSADSSLRPSFTVRVVAPTRAEAERLARNAAAVGSKYVTETTQLRVFAVTSTGQVTAVPVRVWATSSGGRS
jgi:O-antigen ligase